MELNEKSDVYSFGVLTLEVIMGKHLRYLMISVLTSTISTVLNTPLTNILDQRISPPRDQVAEKVAFLVKLAFSCLPTHNLGLPSNRFPNSQQPANISRAPLPLSFDKVTLEHLVNNA